MAFDIFLGQLRASLENTKENSLDNYSSTIVRQLGKLLNRHRADELQVLFDRRGESLTVHENYVI